MPDLHDRPRLAEALRTLPDKAGVYLFKDDRGRLLYVGKAESLRDRVRSYFHDEALLSPKIRRVVEKQAPISEVLLVLDATTGQNGLAQADAFIEHGGVTGLVLTKLDGSAKGGFVLAVQEKTGLPIKLIGQGEGIGDLTGFTPHVFAQKLVG